MNYRNAAIKAREVVRQSHTPAFHMPKTRPRILSLYREIMRYTNKYLQPARGNKRVLSDKISQETFRFAVWNAFHKNRYVSDRKSIDVMEVEGRMYVAEPLQDLVEPSRSTGSLVLAQHHTRDFLRRIYTTDHMHEFLIAQGLPKGSPQYRSIIDDPVLETDPSLKFVRNWNTFIEKNRMPIVSDYEQHLELLELESGTCMTAMGLQFMTWCTTRKAISSLVQAKRLIHLKKARIYPPLFGRTYNNPTKVSSLWTNTWRRTFKALPPMMDMATFKHLKSLADNIEKDKFVALRAQQTLVGYVGVEVSPEGKLVCDVYKPKHSRALQPGQYKFSELKLRKQKKVKNVAVDDYEDDVKQEDEEDDYEGGGENKKD